MAKNNRPLYEEHVVASLRADPVYAAAYVNMILEEGSQGELLVALRRVADARGGIPELARDAQLNATSLYRTLSPQGNPELKSLTKVLRSLGMKLSVTPLGALTS